MRILGSIGLRHLGVLAGVLALSAGAFALGRIAGEGDSVRAGPGDGQVAAPGETATPPPTPAPGATPDTSVPGWWLPYVEQDEQRPQFDQVINGILIGPTVDNVGHCTVDGQFELEVAAGSRVGIDLDWLPDDATVFGRSATCDGEPVGAEANVGIPPDPEDERKLLDGEIGFFEARHGGSIRIVRSVEEGQPTHQIERVPAERFAAGTVAGLPAAIGEPLFAEGFGTAVVAVWDEQSSVITVVEGVDFAVEELIRIAEEVIR